MRKLNKSVLIPAAALAATAAFSVPAAAASTWTISPGGQVTATTSGIVKAEDVDSGAVVTCDSASGKGSVPSGTGLSGNGLVTVSEITFANCVGPANVKETITATGLPWKLDAAGSYDAATGTTTGQIKGVTGSIDGSDGCRATFAGPDGNPGYIEGSYVNSKGQLTGGGGNLVVASVNASCPPDLIAVGDKITLSAVLNVSPRQTITSP